MSTLMCNISGFGWDLIAKTFIASDEVWKDYLKVQRFPLKNEAAISEVDPSMKGVLAQFGATIKPNF
ncbi:unnamed protein product [Prunus armeniaca]